MAERDMESPVRLAAESWRFHAVYRCSKEKDALRFHDRLAALGWLRRFRANPLAMLKLRGLAANRATQASWQLRDDAFLEYFAGMLARGAWHVHLVPRPKIAGGSQQDAAAPAPRPVPPPRKAQAEQAVAPPTPGDPDLFSPLVDAVATAAVLRAASVDGVPFCEECAQAAALRAAHA